MSDNLATDIAVLLNRYSAENASNTPDFILAHFLVKCLAAFDRATQQRDTWYGRDARPTHPPLAAYEKEAGDELPKNSQA